MRIAVFSSRKFDEQFLSEAFRGTKHHLEFFETRLNAGTVGLATGFDGVCVFVNDSLDAPVIRRLSNTGCKIIALRCAGFNNVDLSSAEEAGIAVVHVPEYSPHAVAEHTFGIILCLNRKIHRAYQRVRDGNFALDGLLGFDLKGRTLGIVGTGRIGRAAAQIGAGFGCNVLLHDPFPNEDASQFGTYTDLEQLLSSSHIVSLHCPLTPETQHLIDANAIEIMRPGVMLINTSRGALVDSKALIGGLKSGKIGTLGLDVYEEEADLFFEDRSSEILQDDVFIRLLTFPNVLITSHQAFFTADALQEIATATKSSVDQCAAGEPVALLVPRP
ncbi:MAG: 2-hydroxyacid dehydrogenase [Planctomycetota bacterium]